MSSNQQSNDIIENALKINKAIDPFLKEIEGLFKAVDAINPFHPLACIELHKISRSREEKRSEYYAKLNLCHNALNVETSSQGAEINQLRIISKGLIAVSRLQDAWGGAWRPHWIERCR